MANRNKRVEVPDTIMVTCTDNGQDVEVEYISQYNNIIRTSLQGIPLNFYHHRANIYVANAHGREFVMKL
jgi:hypothetical protein